MDGVGVGGGDDGKEAEWWELKEDNEKGGGGTGYATFHLNVDSWAQSRALQRRSGRADESKSEDAVGASAV